ncbi:MAG: replication initiator protein [Microvirus sp.]|nr:MAG: replication initiator protein [Microvirus sp.]
MPCFHPITISRKGFVDLRQVVACGRCVGCRITRKEAWATRVYHEKQFHERSCFLTLTYADENIPAGGTLMPAHMTAFMKSVRKYLAREHSVLVRFFLCGEYGDQLLRPHYHVCLFGWDFPDKLSAPKYGDGVMVSPVLEGIWGKGFCTVGALTYQSAAYTAGYVMKKVTGEDAPEFYRRLDVATGELVDLVPPFVRMSLRPGIGSDWYGRFGREVFPDDFVVVDGRPRAVPLYYWRKLKSAQPVLAEAIAERRAARRAVSTDESPERLRAREVVAAANFNQRGRDLT